MTEILNKNASQTRRSLAAARLGQISNQRRGVVLIFTVAVLVLLAVIATAYLATARIDRVYVDQKGVAISAGASYGGGDAGLPGAVISEMRRDLYDWSATTPQGVPPTLLPNPNLIDAPPGWRYRPAEGWLGTGGNNTFHNWDYLQDEANGTYPVLDRNVSAASRDRQKNDPWLASRAPSPYDGTAFNNAGGATYFPAWRVLSRWLEYWDDTTAAFDDTTQYPNQIGNFESPYNKNVAWPGPAVITPRSGPPAYPRYVTRHAAIPTFLRIDYPYTMVSPKEMQAKTRIFPALAFTTGPDAGQVFLAGDTDGDGIADAGLFALDSVGASTGSPLFQDGTFPAFHYDPGDAAPHHTRWYAAIRVVDNTAAINLNTAYRSSYDIPVGTIGTDPDTGSTVAPPLYGAATGSAPGFALPNYGYFRSNIGLLELLHAPTATDRDPQWNRLMQYRFGSNYPSPGTGYGDYVQTTRAEALEMNAGRRPQTPGSDANGTYRTFDKNLSANLAFLNGMINPHEGRTDYEKTLYGELHNNAPNFGAVDSADALKETRSFTYFIAPPDVPTAPTLPTATTNSPLFWWHSLYNPDAASRTSYFSTNFPGYTPTPTPIRHLVTTANPQTTAARPSDNGTPPVWVNTATPTTTPMTAFTGGVNPRTSINTDDFGTLWRGFYQVMVQPNAPGQPEADLGDAGRNFTVTQTANATELLYLRSAIAAVNAIDMRDADDDVTTFRIALESTGARQAMVAGCERQLFISSVGPSISGGSINARTITLQNPYPDPMNTACYRLAIQPTGGGSYVAVTPLAGPPSVAGNSSQTFGFDPGAAAPPGDLMLIRTRRYDNTPSTSTDARNPYNEANNDDLVPVDIVINAVGTGGTYTRTATNWQFASAGTAYTSAGAIPNPIAIKKDPSMDHPATAAAGNQFPFGAFARNGDMLLIPFVGSYALYNTTALADAVPMTYDVEFANTASAVTAPQIAGRFVPAPTGAGSLYSNDWRSRLLDNFTTLGNPMNAASPNVAKESWLKNVSGRTDPRAVTGIDAGYSDDKKVPVQGLININTASREVLNMVPFRTTTTGVIDTVANLAVVDAVLAKRRANGPFKGVIDLMAMPGFNATTPPTALQGNFYAFNATEPVLNQWAQDFNNFNRVSNLLTTRSDSFIVYTLLQQWQDFGTNQPVLLSESRSAAVVDRSQFTQANMSRNLFILQSVPTE